MNEKIINRMVIAIILVAILSICCLPAFNNITALADTNSTEPINVGYFNGYGKDLTDEQIHNATRIPNYVEDAPSITVLVHGQGGNASHWSNSASKSLGNFLNENEGEGIPPLSDDYSLVYDQHSIIEKLRSKIINANVYLAKMSVNENGFEKSINFNGGGDNPLIPYQKNRFFLTKLEYENYDTNFTFELEKNTNKTESNPYDYVKSESAKRKERLFVDKIEDVSQHTIIVFESADPNSYHRNVFKELHNVIDRVSYDILCITGRIPTVNLISHSRGGLVSMMYATGYTEGGAVELSEYVDQLSGGQVEGAGVGEYTKLNQRFSKNLNLSNQGEILFDHPFNVSGLYSMGTPYQGIEMVEKMPSLANMFAGKELACDSGSNIIDPNVRTEIFNNWERAISKNPKLTLNPISGEFTPNFLLAMLAFEYENIRAILNGAVELSNGGLQLAIESLAIITFLVECCFGDPIREILTYKEGFTANVPLLGFVFEALITGDFLELSKNVKESLESAKENVNDLNNFFQSGVYDDQAIVSRISSGIKRIVDLLTGINSICRFFTNNDNFNCLSSLGDLTVDKNSQLATEFNNVGERCNKKFDSKGVHYVVENRQYRANFKDNDEKAMFKKCANTLGIPHILETYDPEIHKFILNKIELEIPETNYVYSQIGNKVVLTGLKDSNYYENLKDTQIELDLTYGINGNPIGEIGDYSFNNVRGINKITLTNVKKIGQGAFSNSYELSTVVANEALCIDDYAFSSCISLSAFELPNGLTSIGAYAFENCQSLNGIIIPNSVVNLGEGAFKQCENLASVCLSNNLIIIEDRLFEQCNSLKTVVLPLSISEIGDGAFFGCEGLQTVEHGDNIVIISQEAFQNCYNLVNFEIPAKLVEIGNNAFLNCNKLSLIDLPTTLNCVGYGAFENCDHLESVKIPTNLNEISPNMFKDCDNLRIITLHNNITAIGNNAFENCVSIESLTTKPNIVYLGEYSFAGCTSLKNISLPNKIDVIRKGAFSGCLNMSAVTIQNSTVVIEERAFENCQSLKTVTIPYNATHVGDWAFSGCLNLTTVSTQNKIQYIGNGAFYNCEKLKSIKLSQALTYIGNNAFNGCRSLTSISIPSSTQFVGAYAFLNCDNLQLTINENAYLSNWDENWNDGNNSCIVL